MTDHQKTCTYCGGHEAPLLQARDHVICGGCVKSFHEAIAEDQPPAPAIKITPSAIKAQLDRHVVGQEQTKRALALAVYNHLRRVSLPKPSPESTIIEKSNILMIGPSGTGKTLMVKTIAKMADVPMVVVDATGMTEAGYIGNDVDVMLQMLIAAADGDISRAEKGIIFVDEVDKLARRDMGASVSKDPSGEGVQQALLKIIEGTNVSVAVSGRNVMGSAKQSICTDNILFVCSGAFVGLDEIVKKANRKTEGGMGFSSRLRDTEPDNKENIIHLVEPDNLFAFGLIPELVGRLPVICTLDALTIDDLEKIATEPVDSVVNQFKRMVEIEGHTLNFTNEAIREIANLAHKRKTGARGLRSIVEKTLTPVMFDLPDSEETGKTITVDVVDGELVVS